MIFIGEVFTLFVFLLIGHALADFPLQGDYLSKGKAGVFPDVPWYYLMGVHSAIHMGVVLIITGNMFLALAEFVLHFAIDRAKCKNRITYMQDQALHILCKLAWAFLAAYSMQFVMQ